MTELLQNIKRHSLSIAGCKIASRLRDETLLQVPVAKRQLVKIVTYLFSHACTRVAVCI